VRQVFPNRRVSIKMLMRSRSVSRSPQPPSISGVGARWNARPARAVPNARKNLCIVRVAYASSYFLSHLFSIMRVSAVFLE
jgi:hypothetical protein